VILIWDPSLAPAPPRLNLRLFTKVQHLSAARAKVVVFTQSLSSQTRVICTARCFYILKKGGEAHKRLFLKNGTTQSNLLLLRIPCNKHCQTYSTLQKAKAFLDTSILRELVTHSIRLISLTWVELMHKGLTVLIQNRVAVLELVS